LAALVHKQANLIMFKEVIDVVQESFLLRDGVWNNLDVLVLLMVLEVFL
jgi:hypothetical protein